MRRLIVLLVAIAACTPPALQVGVSAQRAALVEPESTPTPLSVWEARSRTAAAAREAACPSAPRGCFALPPTCETRICFCTRVCAPAAADNAVVWGHTPSECRCAPS